ncbi:MAG TPA: hypothetical protein VLS89_05775, partial [Candidatus Nanopelagicales bacterium]|nr:hypothetical protein [Candidatus Nanopelagicales bacterium]
CAAATMLLGTTFSAGLAPLAAVDAGADAKTWFVCDDGPACGFSNTTGSASGGPFALVRDENLVSMDGEILVSPALSAAGQTWVVLELDHAFDHAFAGSDLGVIEVQVGGAGAWTPVATFQTDAQGRERVDLSAMVAGQPFQVRFRYDDDTTNAGGFAEGWRIDDVVIWGL